MQTRIRELRKRLGFTLQYVATRTGTTPQTIQRLETGHMSVSLAWLQRIAPVLEVHVADLIDHRNVQRIPFLGEFGSDTVLKPDAAKKLLDPVVFDIPARDPIAIKLAARSNCYEAGSILIADRLAAEAHETALDRDCIVALVRGGVVLRRVVRGIDDTITLVGLEMSTRTQHNVRPTWIAPIIMAVRYF